MGMLTSGAVVCRCQLCFIPLPELTSPAAGVAQLCGAAAEMLYYMGQYTEATPSMPRASVCHRLSDILRVHFPLQHRDKHNYLEFFNPSLTC